MSLYIGKLGTQWVHTYSKKLRDKYLGKDYVVVFTLGTGKNGGTKVRNSISLQEYEWTRIQGKLPKVVILESGKVVR